MARNLYVSGGMVSHDAGVVGDVDALSAVATREVVRLSHTDAAENATRNVNQIQEALNAVGDVGGGLVRAPATGVSNFIHVNGTLRVPDGVTLAGHGKQITQFKPRAGTNLDAVIASSAWYDNRSSSGLPCHVSDLSIEGNKQEQTSGAGHGVVLMNFRSSVERVRVRSARGTGILLTDKSRDDTTISNNMVECRVAFCEVVQLTLADGGGPGIEALSSASNVTDGFMLYNIVQDPIGAGIFIARAGGWVVEGNHIYGGLAGITDAIDCRSCFGTRIIGNQAADFGYSTTTGTYYGISAQGATGSPSPRGSVIANNTIFTDEDTAANTYVGLRLTTTTDATCHWTVTGNVIAAPRVTTPTLIGIQTRRTGTGNNSGTIVGNDVYAVATEYDEGVSSVGTLLIDIPRSAAIPDASGGTVVDAEARAAINDLLAYFRSSGTVAP